MIFHFILSELHLLSPALDGPHGHLEVFRQSVIIMQWPREPAGKGGFGLVQWPSGFRGGTHFEILRV